jgi:hypothetical protein
VNCRPDRLWKLPGMDADRKSVAPEQLPGHCPSLYRLSTEHRRAPLRDCVRLLKDPSAPPVYCVSAGPVRGCKVLSEHIHTGRTNGSIGGLLPVEWPPQMIASTGTGISHQPTCSEMDKPYRAMIKIPGKAQNRIPSGNTRPLAVSELTSSCSSQVNVYTIQYSRHAAPSQGLCMGIHPSSSSTCPPSSADLEVGRALPWVFFGFTLETHPCLPISSGRAQVEYNQGA